MEHIILPVPMISTELPVHTPLEVIHNFGSWLVVHYQGKNYEIKTSLYGIIFCLSDGKIIDMGTERHFRSRDSAEAYREEALPNDYIVAEDGKGYFIWHYSALTVSTETTTGLQGSGPDPLYVCFTHESYDTYLKCMKSLSMLRNVSLGKSVQCKQGYLKRRPFAMGISSENRMRYVPTPRLEEGDDEVLKFAIPASTVIDMADNGHVKCLTRKDVFIAYQNKVEPGIIVGEDGDKYIIQLNNKVLPNGYSCLSVAKHLVTFIPNNT